MSALALEFMSAEQLLGELVERTARRVVELQDEHAQQPAALLLDVKAVAVMLGVSEAFVYRHRLELGAVCIGEAGRKPADGSGNGRNGRLRFVRDDVMAWIERNRLAAHGPEPSTLSASFGSSTTVERLPIRGVR